MAAPRKSRAQRAAERVSGFPLQRRAAGRAIDQDALIQDSLPTCDSDPKPWEAARSHLIAATDASDTAERAAIKSARSQAMREVETEDRDNLGEWWRDQSQFIEQELQTLHIALKDAGDHPSPQYAMQVRRLGALGIPQHLIAMQLGISEGVLAQHYETDLRIGEGLMLAPVAANMYRMATSGNTKAAVKAGTEILNRRGGDPWRPPAQKVEITDERKNSGKGVIDSSKLSPEDREYLKGIVERQLGLRNNSTMLGISRAAIDVDHETLDGDEV